MEEPVTISRGSLRRVQRLAYRVARDRVCVAALEDKLPLLDGAWLLLLDISEQAAWVNLYSYYGAFAGFFCYAIQVMFCCVQHACGQRHMASNTASPKRVRHRSVVDDSGRVTLFLPKHRAAVSRIYELSDSTWACR